MKKIIGILLIIVLVCICTGCAEVEAEQETSMFVEVERSNIWKVVYHKNTKVMYAVSWSSYNMGTFTLLVDADGKPLLWESEK